MSRINETIRITQETRKTPLLYRNEVVRELVKLQSDILCRGIGNDNGLDSAIIHLKIKDQSLESEPGWIPGDARVIGLLDIRCAGVRQENAT